MFDDSPPTLLEATRDEHECHQPCRRRTVDIDTSYLRYITATDNQPTEDVTLWP